MANIQFQTRLEGFLKTALQYLDKEIALPSGQRFSIDLVRDAEKEREKTYTYQIQYGFPQAGAICVSLEYCFARNELIVDKTEVFVPPADRDLSIANFAPQVQNSELTVSINFGMDNGTIAHSDEDDIVKNPNALKMFDLAISDLTQARILGDCQICVPSGSKTIPVCHSTRMNNRDITR